MKETHPHLYPGLVCLNCANTHFLKVFDGKDRLLNNSEKFEIVKCVHCNIFYTFPQISAYEMEKFYPEEYICYVPAIEKEDNLLKRFDKQRALSKRRKQIERICKGPGKILDIGCATGNFLNEMSKYGWECFGVEPDKKSAEYAMHTYNFSVFNGYLESVHYQNNYFDVVTMWDVLEHTKDPTKILREVHRILKQGGLFLISLPNSNSYERFLFGPYWAGWEVPRHYVTFNNKNITSFLEKENFTDVKITSFFGRHGLFMISFKFWIVEIQLNRKIKKFFFTVMNSLAMRLITIPIFLFLEFINRSTIMSASAKKKEITP